jgi:hypothetical protein
MLQIPPKCRYISTKLQDITTQRTVNLIFTVSKNPGAPTYLSHARFIQILDKVFAAALSLFPMHTGYSLIINVGYNVLKCTSTNKITVLSKGKAVPLQAWSGPEGSRKLRLPDFITKAQDGGKVASLMQWPPLPPGNTPGTHFC